MISNSTNFFEREIKDFCFENFKKEDYSKTSLLINEMSTHSDVKESKYCPKIFKIQKYVKSGKFENKILSEEEFSEEEILENNEIGKKISPFSKVNFSKLRNKEKVQRYFMMKKLIKNLNFKLKKLEKQVTKNPCDLLNKLANIKISKLEKLSAKNSEKNKNKIKINTEIENFDLNNEKYFSLEKTEKKSEFKFDNLAKAAKKLYFYEDFEFCDEKNLLNNLFRLFDSDKTNLNSFHFKKISNILRSINNNDTNIKNEKINSSIEDLDCKAIKKEKEIIKKSLIRENQEENNHNPNLFLNESNSEEDNDLPNLNLKFKIIDDEDNLEISNITHESLKIEITKRDLELINNSNDQKNILKILSNLDDKNNIHLFKKINYPKSCELKLNNNSPINKNNKKNLIDQKNSDKLKNKKLIKNKLGIINENKNDDLVCSSKLKYKKILKLKNKNYISNSQIKIKNEKETNHCFLTNSETNNFPNKEIFEQKNNNSNFTQSHNLENVTNNDFGSYLIKIMNDNINNTINQRNNVINFCKTPLDNNQKICRNDINNEKIHCLKETFNKSDYLKENRYKDNENLTFNFLNFFNKFQKNHNENIPNNIYNNDCRNLNSIIDLFSYFLIFQNLQNENNQGRINNNDFQNSFLNEKRHRCFFFEESHSDNFTQIPNNLDMKNSFSNNDSSIFNNFQPILQNNLPYDFSQITNFDKNLKFGNYI